MKVSSSNTTDVMQTFWLSLKCIVETWQPLNHQSALSAMFIRSAKVNRQCHCQDDNQDIQPVK
jgi:hypothetical protein